MSKMKSYANQFITFGGPIGGIIMGIGGGILMFNDDVSHGLLTVAAAAFFGIIAIDNIACLSNEIIKHIKVKNISQENK